MLNNTNVIIEALNYTRAGVLITDPSLEDNPIVYANQGFVDMTGYTKEDIIGKNCRFLQGEETNRSEVSRLREGIKNKTSVFVEFVNYKKKMARSFGIACRSIRFIWKMRTSIISLGYNAM